MQEKSFDEGTKQVYEAFIKCVVLFLWPTHLRNVNSSVWTMWHTQRCFFYIPNAQATLPYFYSLVHYSIPVVSCLNILCLIVPVPFTLWTPCFPCPMLFDMHISWSHKWILLIQDTAASPACFVLLIHIPGTARRTESILCLCSFTLISAPLWD